MNRAQSAVDYYDRLAGALAPAYDTVTFEAVHGAVLHHLPEFPANILDVGAGSGRDALALVQRGFKVTAVEPAASLRKLGEARARSATWIDDRLPELAVLQERRDRFDFILCSAVLMSIAPPMLGEALMSMATLLRDGGKLAVSVRVRSTADLPGIFHEHSDGSIVNLGIAAGLTLLERQQVSDALGRAHRWSGFIFQRRPTAED